VPSQYNREICSLVISSNFLLVPVLGFNKPASLHFLLRKGWVFATASTCDLILRLLTCHKDYAKFAEQMVELLLNAEYGLP